MSEQDPRQQSWRHTDERTVTLHSELAMDEKACGPERTSEVRPYLEG